MLTSTSQAYLNANYSPDFNDLMTMLELRFDGSGQPARAERKRAPRGARSACAARTAQL
jgi:hypothetical protein